MTAMDDKTLVEWDLSPEEKATLLAHTKWTDCPMCEGQPPRDKPDAFCVLCGNEGKVTNGTRDVTAHLRLSYQHSFERIEALKAALRECIDVMGPMAKHPNVNPWLIQAKQALEGEQHVD